MGVLLAAEDEERKSGRFAPRLHRLHNGRVPSLHVYVHFPWCLEKCPYCDFVSFATSREAIDHEGYADAILRELGARGAALTDHRLATIFLGGGTPSLWSPQAIARVVRGVLDAFPHDPHEAEVEVTSECNPTSLDSDRARALLDAGVNRLSIGVQSLDDTQLRFLGRLHDVELARRSLRAAIATGARVSADLIYALPGQPAAVAAAHAIELVEMGLDHLSAYSLTVEPGTRFGELARKGKLPIAEEDATCDAFLAIEAALGERGLRHYEVSNYARPGHEARHNLGYWHGAPYLGLGCAAYGCAAFADDDVIRYRNQAEPGAYVEGTRSLARGVPRVGDGVTMLVEPLDGETLLRERIMLGLRLAEGVDLDRAARELGLPEERVLTPERRKTLERLVREGSVSLEGSRVRIAEARRLATDGIASRLF
jgi:putative oxygen-independent coproporphyrinogen III oxidase